MDVYCKKSISHYKGGKKYSQFFEKGKYYEIHIEYDDCIWIFTNKSKFSTQLFGKYHPSDSRFLFSDYFYTLKELRKLKINKLNEYNRTC